ncbi:MAG: MBOAT family protein, partial [Flavobacteriales bacterium]|nr:MBOAT family protein [Flavobacteriales bacterium]
MITFLVSGLWHGASWTFIIWGALHGVYMVLGQLFRTHGPRTTATVVTDRLPRSRRVLQALLTFGLVALAWVFFRATS